MRIPSRCPIWRTVNTPLKGLCWNYWQERFAHRSEIKGRVSSVVEKTNLDSIFSRYNDTGRAYQDNVAFAGFLWYSKTSVSYTNHSRLLAAVETWQSIGSPCCGDSAERAPILAKKRYRGVGYCLANASRDALSDPPHAMRAIDLVDRCGIDINF